MNLSGFDATLVPEQQDFSALPAGEYVVIAVASEEKPTKNGTGSFLQLTFEVVEGQCKGRKLWARLNVKNQNKTAVDIAQRELGAICRAVGILRPEHSSELHNRPLLVKVDVEMDDKNRQSNVIKKYLPVAAPAPAFSAPMMPAQAAPAVAPQQAPSATPPWMK